MMKKNMDKIQIDEIVGALDRAIEKNRIKGWEQTIASAKVLPEAMYVEKQADDKWEYMQSPVSKHVRYEILETRRDVSDSFPYNVQIWHEIDKDQWAYAGDGIFCKTLEQAHDYISTQQREETHDNFGKIMKVDENIREVQQKGDESKLFIKKHDIWWPAYKNDKGEIYPNIWAVGNEHEIIHNNLKRMLSFIEKTGEKEIDFSNWAFTNVTFDKSLMGMMGFADKINFQNAGFCFTDFLSGQLENADFSKADFDMCRLKKSIFHNCDFSKTIWSDPADGDMKWGNKIMNSVFIGCRFKDIRLNHTEVKRSRFLSTIPKMLNKLKQSVIEKSKKNVRTSVHNKLKGFQQKVKIQSSDQAVQREFRREER